MSGVGKVSEKKQVCIEKKVKQLYFKDILTDFKTDRIKVKCWQREEQRLDWRTRSVSENTTTYVDQKDYFKTEEKVIWIMEKW